ncbi:MAG: protein BatD [Candidatus Omnitrophica bacterium]|nr:protein BatD [Candidatus Omnitrophota bacterium]
MRKYLSVSISIFVFLFGALFGGYNKAMAEDISVVATVDANKVPLGSALNFTISINGTQNVSDLNLPEIDGFDMKYIGPSRNISIVNTQYTSSISFNYSLLPLKTGQLKIPAFQLNIEGKTLSTEEITIDVIDGQSQQPSGNVTQLNDKIYLQVVVSKTELSMNEPLEVKVFMYSSGLSLRDIQYPRIEHAGFIDESFDQPKQYQQVLEGRPFDIFEFSKIIYPTRSGALTIGPAQMECNIIVRSQNQPNNMFEDDFFNSFFDRGEKRPLTLTSQAVTVNVKELPLVGKPSDFSGAVGNFTYTVSASPTDVQVGDPITLKMKIEGQGNLKAVEFPKIDDEEKFKLYDPIIKEEGRIKTLEQVLIPKSETVMEIPETKFTFFNHESGKYEVLSQGPFPITVKKAEQDAPVIALDSKEQPVVGTAEKIGEDIVFIKDSPGGLGIKKKGIRHGFLYFFILFLMFGCLIGGEFWFKITHKMETDQEFAKQLNAARLAKKELKKSKQYISENRPKEFYDYLYKTFFQYLSHKFNIPVGMVAQSEIKKLLAKYLIDKDVMNDIDRAFQECESIRYASGRVSEGQMNISQQRVERVIDYMERKVR